MIYDMQPTEQKNYHERNYRSYYNFATADTLLKLAAIKVETQLQLLCLCLRFNYVT
jgi:hypothetical protein